MFVGSTILVHLLVGELAQRTIKSYFYDVAAQHLVKKFDGFKKRSDFDFTKVRTVRRFDREPSKIWNINKNTVTYQNTQTQLPLAAGEFFVQNQNDKFLYRLKVGEEVFLLSSFFVDQNNTLVIGINTSHHLDFFEAVNTLIFWFTVAVSVLAGIYSTVIVNNALRPLKRFETYLSRVRPGRLDIRVPTKKLPIELETLSYEQNAMLDRLDLGFQRLSDFSTDIAHELRTPLTNLTTQTQVALSNDRDIEEYRDILGSNLEELERINKTINDTLYLAKAENSLLYQEKEHLDLAKEISQLIEFQEILAEDKGITITLTGNAELYADRQMLQRAINNLISNAVRHAYENSRIDVKIIQDGKDLQIAISNDGKTISEDNLPFIFDRFYRGDCSRSQGEDCSAGAGAGLGLAITKSIIETFDGNIIAKSENEHTTFEITIPQTAST